MAKYNIFEKRALEFIYCNTYNPEIDDALSSYEYQRNKMFWSSIFDFILLPIGFFMLYRKKRHFSNSKGASHSLNKGYEVNQK